MTRNEVRERFRELNTGEYDFDGFYNLSKQLMEDGPTTEEIKGFVDSRKDMTSSLNPVLDESAKTIDISGTGGDKLNTINVGSIVGLILSAGGLVVGKQSTRAHTGFSGSKDLYDELGIPVSLEKTDSKQLEALLERVGFAAYYYPSFSANSANNIRFFKELKEKGLSFITPWHVAAWLFNPLKIYYRIYGMFTDKYFDAVANVLVDSGTKKGWIVSGVDGLDEISNVGKTKVLEFTKDNKKELVLNPEDFGIKKSKAEDILVNNKEEAIEISKKVINGEEKGPHRDLVVINAAAGLYISGIKDNLKDATVFAIELLESGVVSKKVEEIKSELSS